MSVKNTRSSSLTWSNGLGLTLITRVNFSSVSSVSVNDCFNSMFQNYRIVIRAVHSGDADVQLRLRVGGSDNTSSVYTWSRIAGFASATGGTTTNGSAWDTGAVGTVQNLTEIDILGPNLAEKTVMFSKFTRGNGTGNHGGTHNSATAFDGFTYYRASGTFTGELIVYGYLG